MGCSGCLLGDLYPGGPTRGLHVHPLISQSVPSREARRWPMQRTVPDSKLGAAPRVRGWPVCRAALQPALSHLRMPKTVLQARLPS
jgi:hypothetical protein